MVDSSPEVTPAQISDRTLIIQEEHRQQKAVCSEKPTMLAKGHANMVGDDGKVMF